MNYNSVQVRCPFYRADTKNSIRCEGIIAVSCSNTFGQPTKKKNYIKKYCCNDYEHCRIAQIINEKYN